MGFRLGVDIGTTFTAAATGNGESAMLGLGNRALQVPSVLYLTEDGQFLVGESAERRGLTDPARVVREFKRRMGDPVPILVAGTPFSPQALTARLLSWVVATATERMGAAPDEIVLTHPAKWTVYKREILDQAITLADVGRALTCTEPEAAAVKYAAQASLANGHRVVVYDLGGGTFDVCVLEKTRTGFTILGEPDGVEHLGGIDFDEAVFQHVVELLGLNLDDPALDRVESRTALKRLRQDCVEAKEALSSDVETVIPVALPNRSTSVRFTRSELEALIGPSLQDTVAATERALRSAGTVPSLLKAIVLVGGSSRIPMVSHLLQGHFGTQTALDTHPKHDVALGAVQIGTDTRPISSARSASARRSRGRGRHAALESDSTVARPPTESDPELPTATVVPGAPRRRLAERIGGLWRQGRRGLIIPAAAAALVAAIAVPTALLTTRDGTRTAGSAPITATRQPTTATVRPTASPTKTPTSTTSKTASPQTTTQPRRSSTSTPTTTRTSTIPAGTIAPTRTTTTTSEARSPRKTTPSRRTTTSTPAVARPDRVVAVARTGGGSGEVEVEWDAVESAAGYRVYRSVASGGPFRLAADFNIKLGRVVTAAEEVMNIYSSGHTYHPDGGSLAAPDGSPWFKYLDVGDGERYYRVAAYNAVGEGTRSSVTSASPE